MPDRCCRHRIAFDVRRAPRDVLIDRQGLPEPLRSRTDLRMYEKRFGLHRKPFQSLLSDHDFFESGTYRELLPTVLHALRSDLGVAVLTGPAGAGKSVTLEHLRRILESDSHAVLIRGGTVRSAADLLYLLHRKMLKCHADTEHTTDSAVVSAVRRWEVVERLERMVEFWGPLIVLLDDAHLVQPDVFAELRTLLEEDFVGQKLLRLLISGPLVLEEILAEPGRADFSQKIRAHVFLQPLTSPEAVAYLAHQMKAAGAQLSKVMDSKAIEQIVAAADGIPRCLNLLADECLMVCHKANASLVTPDIVDQALERLHHLPYAWNVSMYDSQCDNSHDDDSKAEDDGDDMEFAAKPSREPAAPDTNFEPGVFEIGGSPVPSASTGAKAVSTRRSDVVDGHVIEIGNLSEPQPPSRHDPVEVASGTESSDSDVLSAGGATEELTATEIGYDEFFPHVDGLAEFEDSDELPVWPAESMMSDTTFVLDDAAFDDEELSDAELSEEEPEVEIDSDLESALVAKLEHHRLLTSASAAPDPLCEDAEADSDWSAADIGEDLTATEVSFSEFCRWQPAGSWPATPPSVCGVDAETSSDSMSPVFDRYTWCELGRPVSTQAPNRHGMAPLYLLSNEWPPATNGVAPTDSVAVVEVHMTASLLADLKLLIDTTMECFPVDEDACRDPWL
ncbi:MAG: AAA family ATPase [Planctomycetaceae bacterium]